MIREQDGFHLADLLALRMRTILVVPGETRSLSALMNHLTGLPIPVRFLPGPLLDMADRHVCEQYPWLQDLKISAKVGYGDWAAFWVWMDVVQRRVGTEANDWGRAFPVEPMGADKLTIHVADVDGDYPDE